MRFIIGIRSILRILVSLLILFSFTASGLVMARSNAADDLPPRLAGDNLFFGGYLGSAQMQVDASSLSAVDLTARAGQLQVKKTALLDAQYITFSGEGLGHGATTGLPDLPVLRRDVEIPYGARYTLELISSQYTEVSLADLGLPAQILPLQPSQPKCGDPVAPCQPDSSVYQQDAFFPASPLVLGGEYQVRGHRALTIEAWPVAYNPVQGTLRLYSELRFRIRLLGSDAIQTLSQSARLASPAFEQTLSNTLLNYNLNQGARLQANLNSVNYLIIVADAYQAGIADFVAMKQSQGFAVTVANTTTTGSTKESIQAYIAAQYSGANPPSYVLFVGDTNTIPNWPFKTSGQTYYLTDLYHVTMDGASDFVPDIYRGRFPVRSTEQLANMVNNNLWYANVVTGAEPWVKKISYLATGTDGEWALVEATHNYCIEAHTQPAGYTGIFPVNPTPGGDKLYAKTYSANGTNVINSLNDGRALTIYSGHGSTTSWANPSVTQATVRSLTGNPIPYVVGHACVTADFNVAEAFSDTWVIQDGSGALVYLGASDNSYWDEDDILQREIFNALYDPAPGDPVIAQAMYTGLAAVQTGFGDSTGQYYWEEYNLFGDPSLVIVTGPRDPDFTLDASPDRVEMCNAATATGTISVGSLNEFSTPVDLSLSGAPAGVTSGFAPTTVTPAGQSILTLANDGSAAPGAYTLTISGAAGTLTHTTQVDLDIFNTFPATSTLLAPADGALNQVVTPTFTWSAGAQASTYTLQVATDVNFNNLVVNQPGITSASYTLATALETSASYYWRVIAHNPCGSVNSAAFTFSTVSAPGDCVAGTVPQTLYFSDLESGLSGWTDASTGSYHWATSTVNAYSPVRSALAVDVVALSDQRLVSPPFVLPASDQQPLTFSFWQWHAFENPTTCYDAGLLEISADGGGTWTQLTPLAGSYAYNGTVQSNFGNPLAGKPAWCGSSASWQRTAVDLGVFAGQSVQLRLRLGTDSSVGNTGWYVDNLRVQACRPDYEYPFLFPVFWK